MSGTPSSNEMRQHFENLSPLLPRTKELGLALVARAERLEAALQEAFDILDSFSYEELRDGIGGKRAAALLRYRSDGRAALGAAAVGGGGQ